MPDIEAFRKDLTHIINYHSLESLCDTPDFILADYFIDCFVAYTRTVSSRDRWFGINMWREKYKNVPETIHDGPVDDPPEPQYIYENVVLEPLEIIQTRIICKMCGEDLSLYAGVCPNQHAS